MKHLAKIVETQNIRPFHVECSCGVSGDFATKETASSWMQVRHFDRLSGISTCEFEKEEEQAAPAPSQEEAKPVEVEQAQDKKKEPSEENQEVANK